MSTPAATVSSRTTPSESVRSTGVLRFDWIMAALSAFVVFGAYLDGWAHRHGKVDESFLTPWHGVLYGTVLLTGMVLVIVLRRNHDSGRPWRAALPHGYLLSLIGIAVFAVAGLGDLVWHTLFGIEVDVESLLSPTHLTLALGAVLIVGGPLRSGWRHLPHGDRIGWAAAPPVISAAAVVATLAFMTQFAHPLVDVYAARTVGEPEPKGEIYVMAADGSGQTRLTVRPETWNSWPAWSPDGRRMAFSMFETDKWPIYVMNADGSGVTPILDAEKTENYAPAWSPDGTKIAFASRPSGQGHGADVFTINADGSNVTRLTRSDAEDQRPVWSPDGRRIAFASTRDGGWQVYLMDSNGDNQQPLTRTTSANWGPSWSPDGRSIAFVSDRDKTPAIYVIDIDGTNERRLTSPEHAGSWPSWSPDGRRIAFSSNADGNDELYVMNSDGSGVTNLTRNPALRSLVSAWSPDGTKIAFSGSGQSGHAALAQRQSLGILSILLQTGLLMGMILLLVRQFRLPFGALTAVFTLTSLPPTFLKDELVLLPAAIAAGMVADLLLWRLQPDPSRRFRLYLFAFAVPAVAYGLYFLNVLLDRGLGWSVHLWAGTIVLAGVVGLLLSFLIAPPMDNLHVSAEASTRADT